MINNKSNKTINDLIQLDINKANLIDHNKSIHYEQRIAFFLHSINNLKVSGKISDEDYSDLIKSVKQATDINFSQSNLNNRIEKFGDLTADITKKIASLLK